MFSEKKFGLPESLIKAVAEAAKPHTVPKTEKDKKLASLAEPKDKITHKDVMVGRGVVAKEEAEQIEELKSSTMMSYKDKANKEIKALDKEVKTGEYKDIAAKIMDRRMKGADRAANKLATRKEEVEPIEELSKATLASYAKKAVSDARFKQGIGKDYEALGKRKRDPATKASFSRMGLKVRMKAKSREEGAAKAIDRLAKEEVELDEISDIAHAKYRTAARADIKTQSKMLDADSKAGDRIEKRVAGLARSTGLEKVKKMAKEEMETTSNLSTDELNRLEEIAKTLSLR